MAIAMMYGVPHCILATFIHTIGICSIVRIKNRTIPDYKIIFNITSAICTAWIYANVFKYFHNGGKEIADINSGKGIADIFIPAVLLVVSYFLSNSILLSLAMAWSKKENVARIWLQNLVPYAVDFPVSAVAAGTIYVFMRQFNEIYAIAAAPIIGVVWMWQKVNKEKKQEAENHLEEQEALYLRTVASGPWPAMPRTRPPTGIFAG